MGKCSKTVPFIFTSHCISVANIPRFSHTAKHFSDCCFHILFCTRMQFLFPHSAAVWLSSQFFVVSNCSGVNFCGLTWPRKFDPTKIYHTKISVYTVIITCAQKHPQKSTSGVSYMYILYHQRAYNVHLYTTNTLCTTQDLPSQE